MSEEKSIVSEQVESPPTAARREPPEETLTALEDAAESLKRNPSACADIPLPQKTQCVRPSRDSGVGVLQSAAKKAARSNSRSDVHEYMRIRRSFV